MTTEYRPASGEVRTAGRDVWATVLTYNQVDTYNTRFMPGCFADSLRRKLPVLQYTHDDSIVRNFLGRAVEYRDTSTKLDLRFRLLDPEQLPDVRHAVEAFREGVLDGFSVGFIREEERVAPGAEGRAGVVDIVRGDLVHVAAVLEPSVPGTALLSIRHAGHHDGERAGPLLQFVRSLAAGVRAGELSTVEARDILTASTMPSALRGEITEALTIDRRHRTPASRAPLPATIAAEADAAMQLVQARKAP